MTTKNPHSIAMLPLGPTFDDVQPLLLQASVLRAAKACIESGEGQFPSPHQRNHAALLVAAPGDFNPEVNANLVKLSRMLWEGLGFGWATVGFTDSTWPLISVSLEHIYRLGFRHIVVFPWTLVAADQHYFTANLMKVLQSAHPDVHVVLAKHLDAHSIPPQAEVANGASLRNCFQCSYRAPHSHDGIPHTVDTPGHHHS
jgi:sirohydrochlorin cobaltochelatase